jgi:WD40 repeat protein
MRLCTFKIAFAVVLLLAACGPQPTVEFLPTETSLPPVPATSPPATQTPAPEPAPTEFNFQPGQTEIIQPGNLARLQLLKTYPAEIPLQSSVVAISLDGKTLAVGSSSTSQILFIDIAGEKSSWSVQVNTAFEGPFDGIEYLADGTLLASSATGYQSYHIDADGKLLARWGYPPAMSADGKMVAYADNAGTVLVDAVTDELLGLLEGNVVLSLSFSPDGSRLAVATAGVDYLTSYVWDVTNQTLLATLNDTGEVRYSPNGKFLAVTSYEGELSGLKVFDADGKTQLASLTAPEGLDGSAPLISADGQLILAQIPNGSPLAWNTTNWQLLDLPVLDGQLDSFSPDGRILITRMPDGAILLWGIPH